MLKRKTGQASVMVVLVLAVLCAGCFGFAAQRGSLCVVSAVATLLDRGSARVFLSFLQCVLWVALISLPAAWLSPGGASVAADPAGLASIIGGLVFGVGAAINGGCSFGTLIRLAAGDMSYIATASGVLAGIAFQRHAMGIIEHPPAAGLSVASEHPAWAGLFFLLAIGHGVHQMANASRRDLSGQWSPGAAAAIMGLSGGVLYVLSGTWNVFLSIGDLFDAGSAARCNIVELIALSTSTLAGAILAATTSNAFRLQLTPTVWPRRFIGGGAMGFGIALIPGGNAVLILHSLPSMSPFAVPVYAALIVGAGAALLVSRTLRRSAHFPRIRNRVP
jgi:uncharacterized membrane protein YedE/YeeE